MMDKRKKRIKELKQMIEVLILAIPREIASQQFYQAAVDKATSETTRKFFLSLVEQEKSHEANLTKILNNLQTELKQLKKQK
jgi:rubrerythrin